MALFCICAKSLISSLTENSWILISVSALNILYHVASGKLYTWNSVKMKVNNVLLFFSAGENGNPLQYSCLENPTDRGAW